MPTADDSLLTIVHIHLYLQQASCGIAIGLGISFWEPEDANSKDHVGGNRFERFRAFTHGNLGMFRVGLEAALLTTLTQKDSHLHRYLC